MNEQRLKQIWRNRPAASAALSAVEQLHAEEAQARQQAIKASAEDARAADLARLTLALQRDAEGLAAEVARARRPQLPVQGYQRFRWALAASLALLAILLVPRVQSPSSDSLSGSAPLNPTDRIVSASFESTAEGTPPTTPAGSAAQVFAGGFDS